LLRARNTSSVSSSRSESEDSLHSGVNTTTLLVLALGRSYDMMMITTVILMLQLWYMHWYQRC
jgi:hypothetical protein